MFGFQSSSAQLEVVEGLIYCLLSFVLDMLVFLMSILPIFFGPLVLLGLFLLASIELQTLLMSNHVPIVFSIHFDMVCLPSCRQ